MAATKPGNKGQIKKGQVLNPGGRPKLPEDLRALMRATGEQMKRDICEVWGMDIGRLFELSGSISGISAGRAAVISCLNNCIQQNDTRGLYVFLDRVLGRVPEQAEYDSEEKPLDESKNEAINKLVSMILDRPKK